LAKFQMNIAAAGSVALALASCAPTPRPAPESRPRGYDCQAGDGPNGELYLVRKLNADGTKQYDFMRWQPQVGAGITITAEWPGGIPEPTLPIGRVTLDWLGSKGSTKERAKLLLQLTTYPSTMPIPAIVPQDGKNPYGRSLLVSWSDMTALARGTNDLYLVLVDRRGAPVDQTRLDPSIFARGEQAIARAKECVARDASVTFLRRRNIRT